MLGFQAEGAAPLVLGQPIAAPRDDRDRHPHRQARVLVGRDRGGQRVGGGIHAVSDDEILSAYRFLAASESIFCEPASAASVAGLLKVGVPAGATVVCTLTGHGLKDPDRAIAEIAVPSAVDADYDAIRAELGLDRTPTERLRGVDAGDLTGEESA